MLPLCKEEAAARLGLNFCPTVSAMEPKSLLSQGYLYLKLELEVDELRQKHQVMYLPLLVQLLRIVKRWLVHRRVRFASD